MDRDELLFHLPAQVIKLEPWNGHEVSWNFKGCTQNAMDSATLPWSLDPNQPTGWSPAADPLATCNQTKVKHHPADYTPADYNSPKEVDAFLKFYPGGVGARCQACTCTSRYRLKKIISSLMIYFRHFLNPKTVACRWPQRPFFAIGHGRLTNKFPP